MRLFLLFLCSILLSNFTNAQSQHTHCGHDLLMQVTETQHPGFIDKVEQVFNTVKNKPHDPTKDGVVYTIPLVVHIVWNTNSPEENLADSVVLSQVATMNEDFRRMNEDTVNTRSIFHDVVGDAEIEFDLQQIVRVQTNATFTADLLGLPENVKQSANGGSDAWDTENYLNIWVCKIDGILGVLGYAYPPANLPNWPDGVSAPSPELDGVVVDFRTFGRNNPNPLEITDLFGNTTVIDTYGRTVVHEVGHYLGIRHIWGDGGFIIGDSCDEDDGVEDTPNAGSQSAFNCDETQNTCTDLVDDLPDMIENYMDYSAETCMNSFTNGQIDIMRAVLEGPRNGLIDGLPTSILTPDPLAIDLKVYPNPADQHLYLSWHEATADQLNFQLVNLLGQPVTAPFVTNSNAGSERLNVSSLPAGIYVLNVSDGEKVISQKVVVE
ncbi:MAG: T9SS type A sorting domain-containing protein [Bacteroidota bacterium]